MFFGMFFFVWGREMVLTRLARDGDLVLVDGGGVRCHSSKKHPDTDTK